LAADLFASLASNHEHTPPTEVRKGIPKLEIAESAIDSLSTQVDSGDSQKDLSVGKSRKTRIKENKKGVETFHATDRRRHILKSWPVVTHSKKRRSMIAVAGTAFIDNGGWSGVSGLLCN